MLLASALGFVKLLALAYVMTPYDYGQYLAYFGMGTLAGALMSAGSVEKTIKAYPRQWLTGLRSEMLRDAGAIAKRLMLRFSLAATVAIVLSILGWISISPAEIMWTSGLGICSAWLALLASLYRAMDSKKLQQYFNLWRSVGTLGCALLAGWVFGWQGAIAGDIAASLLSIGVAKLMVQHVFKDDPVEIVQSAPSHGVASVDKGHHQLYLANLTVASTSMVDKAWVSASIGAAQAGAYGVVMLIPQIAQLLVGVVVQYIGPLVIKFAHIEKHDVRRMNDIRLQAGLLGLFSLVLTAAALIAKRLPYVDFVFLKFSISDQSIAMVGVLAACQIYSVIEFHLIAYDREIEILRASLVSGILFFGLFAFASYLHASIEWYIASVVVSRCGQIWILRRAYLRYA